MRGGAAWECLRVKADMMLFAGKPISERVRGVRENALYKSTLAYLTLPYLESYNVYTHCSVYYMLQTAYLVSVYRTNFVFFTRE